MSSTIKICPKSCRIDHKLQAVMSQTEWDLVSEGPWSRRRKHQSLVSGSKILILGGFDGEGAFDLNDVWSYDGNSWGIVTERAGWSGRDGHCAVVFKGSIFVLGGTDDPYNCKCDVWSSNDGGCIWQQITNKAPWPERWQHAACVHDGKIYVLGGWGDRYLNDVWSSPDGINWTQECVEAPWKARMFLSVINFNGAIYVIGGHDGRVQLGDVWASSDGGKSWTQVCQKAQWQGRQGHATVAIDGYVYLMGGFGGSARLNDLWKSNDCAHWTCVSSNCKWSPRQGHACVTFRGSIYILGGFDESGYCNDVYMLQVGIDSEGDLIVFDSNEIMRDGSRSNNFERQEGYSRRITVSLMCVLETVKNLRKKQNQRERLVRGLINTVALVMKAVNATAGNPSTEALPMFCLASQTMSLDSGDVPPPSGTPDLMNDVTEPPLGKKLCTAPNRGQAISSTLTALSKSGSPYREQLVASGSSVACEKGMSSVKSDQDLRMQIWQVHPESRGNNAENKDHRDVLQEGLPGVKFAAESLDFKRDLGMQNSRTSSAALRESMEKDRALLNSIQRSIRTLAESGDVDDIADKILERTAVAVRAESVAVHLAEHINSVKQMQSGRQALLSATISQLEGLRAAILNKVITPTPEGPPPIAEGTGTIQSEGTADSNFEQCSLTEWEEIVKKCSQSACAIDSSTTESAIQAMCEGQQALSQNALDIKAWLGKGELDMLSATSMDSGLSPFENYAVPDLIDLGPKYSDENPNNATDILESGEKVPDNILVLSDQQEEITLHLDNCRMAVKISSDIEITAITALESETQGILATTLNKGCGLCKNLISQNRLDLMEVKAMEFEMADWLEILNRLKRPEEIREKIDRLISENHAMEDQLLLLEDKRIDLKSALEKCSLKKARKRNLVNGSLSSVSEENTDSVEEIKRNLTAAEMACNEARRSMREWFRVVREFAGGLAPELFHLLPDLQAAGSLLGDGGFAESLKLPKRRLQEYDNVRPLSLDDSPSPSGAGTGVGVGLGAGLGAAILGGDNDVLGRGANSSSSPRIGSRCNRHVLLRASYDGEEVVLKGFIMGEQQQRIGLERELAILSRLRNDSIICPTAVVEDFDTFEITSYVQKVAVFIEYPYYKGGNLSMWLKAAERKPWELQGVARQLLYILLYVHDRGVTHRDIKPSNILMHEDGRMVLADFEFSREIQTAPGVEEASILRAGTRGFMAPEVESGEPAAFPSDMYAFGVLLLFMHYPTLATNLIPGNLQLPSSCENELAHLIQRLLALNQAIRPTAAAALMDPYFRCSFVARLQEEGEVVEQDRKLEAVRDLLHRVRLENRTNLEKATVNRENLTGTVLNYFQNMPLEKIKASLKIIFINEPGVDEGGLLTEMFTLFFESIFSGHDGLFEGSADSVNDARKNSNNDNNSSSSGSNEDSSVRVRNDFVLPSAQDNSPEQMSKLRAFGRSMVKALYEGRRIGNRLCPSVFKFLTGTAPSMRDLQMFDPQTARSLQWTLATAGVEEFGMHFESVGEPEKGMVNDSNKAAFVRAKIDSILVKSRRPQLLSIKRGFSEAIHALSLEAAPFLSLLSHTDWRVMLCGDSAISGPQVNAALLYMNFPKKSKVPLWLKEIILSSSEDHLRKFLVFVTGSPSISSTSSRKVEINVRCQPRSGALPVAHTCFFHLDIPDYKDKETLMSKLTYAVDHATTFEIV